MCFYFVFTVFSTVGFGDIFAVNTTERVILTTFDKGGGGFQEKLLPPPNNTKWFVRLFCRYSAYFCFLLDLACSALCWPRCIYRVSHALSS